MTLSEFVRLYPLRAKNLPFLFGAGTSVAAGMPSAWDLIWQFKRTIYCSEERYSLSLFKNLSDPAIRRQIQSYFDSKGGYPPEDSIEEYSYYFEKAFPHPTDRRIFLAEQLSGMQNSFGHKVLGILMKNKLANLIFTTNFDKAFENAAIDSFKRSDSFFTASIDNSETARKLYYEGTRPFICKLHGDYHSDKLKNTSPELQGQDGELRKILLHSCITNGLIIIGYSGRDLSIMDVLHEALTQPVSFPNGIYWFIVSGSKPLPAVISLIESAREKGIDANLIEIETFDTVMADLIKGFSDLPINDVDQLNRNYFVKPTSYLPEKGKDFPIIRFNAVTVSELPAVARVVKCDFGNEKDLKEILKYNTNSIIATRKKEGIVGFGPDLEFDKIFSPFHIEEKDIYHIPDRVIQYEDSSLKGLLSAGLLMGITRERLLMWTKRRDRYILFPNYKDKNMDNPVFSNLKKELGTTLSGKIPDTHITWLAAAEVELTRKLSGFFLIIAPTIITTKTTSESERLRIAPFVKEATAGWYNTKYDNILGSWLDIIFEDKVEVTFSAFHQDIQGVNAQYKLLRKSPFTKKM